MGSTTLQRSIWKWNEQQGEICHAIHLWSQILVAKLKPMLCNAWCDSQHGLASQPSSHLSHSNIKVCVIQPTLRIQNVCRPSPTSILPAALASNKKMNQNDTSFKINLFWKQLLNQKNMSTTIVLEWFGKARGQQFPTRENNSETLLRQWSVEQHVTYTWHITGTGAPAKHFEKLS